MESNSRWDGATVKKEIKTLAKTDDYFNYIEFVVGYDRVKRGKTIPGITVDRKTLNDYVSYFARGIHQKTIYISNNFGTWNPDKIKAPQ